MDPVYGQLSAIREDLYRGQQYYSPSSQNMGNVVGRESPVVQSVLNPAPAPPPFIGSNTYEATLTAARGLSGREAAERYAESQSEYQERKALVSAVGTGISSAAFMIPGGLGIPIGLGLSMLMPKIADALTGPADPVITMGQLRRSKISSLMHQAAFQELDSFSQGGLGGISVAESKEIGADIESFMRGEGFEGLELERLLGGMGRSNYLAGSDNIKEMTGRVKDYIKTVKEFVTETQASLEEAGEAVGMGMRLGIGRGGMDKFLGDAALGADIANVRVGDYLQSMAPMMQQYGQAGLSTAPIAETFAGGVAGVRGMQETGVISDLQMAQMGGSIGIQSFMQQTGQGYWTSPANRSRMAALSMGGAWNYGAVSAMAAGEGMPEDLMDQYGDLSTEDRLIAQWQSTEFGIENADMMTNAMMGTMVNKMTEADIDDPLAQRQWLVNRGFTRNQAEVALGAYDTRHGWGNAYATFRGTQATAEAQEYAGDQQAMQSAAARMFEMSEAMKDDSNAVLRGMRRNDYDVGLTAEYGSTTGKFSMDLANAPGLAYRSMEPGRFYLQSAVASLRGMSAADRAVLEPIVEQAVNQARGGWKIDERGFLASDAWIGTDADFSIDKDTISAFGQTYSIDEFFEKNAGIYTTGTGISTYIQDELEKIDTEARRQSGTAGVGDFATLINTTEQMERLNYIERSGVLADYTESPGMYREDFNLFNVTLEGQGRRTQAPGYGEWRREVSRYQLMRALPTSEEATANFGAMSAGTTSDAYRTFVSPLQDALERGEIGGGTWEENLTSVMRELGNDEATMESFFDYSRQNQEYIMQWGSVHLGGTFRAELQDFGAQAGKITDIDDAMQRYINQREGFTDRNRQWSEGIVEEFDLNPQSQLTVALAMGEVAAGKDPREVIASLEESEAGAFNMFMGTRGEQGLDPLGASVLLGGAGMYMSKSLVRQRTEQLMSHMDFGGREVTVEEFMGGEYAHDFRWKEGTPEDIRTTYTGLTVDGEMGEEYLNALMQDEGELLSGPDGVSPAFAFEGGDFTITGDAVITASRIIIDPFASAGANGDTSSVDVEEAGTGEGS